MAVAKRWDSTSIFLITWIVGIGVIATAIAIASPFIRQSIFVPKGFANEQQLAIGSDPEQTELIATPNHSEVVR
jgi:hypothetical protein